MSTRKHNAFIGNAVERVEDLRFLRGKGQYVDDLTMPGLLHAVVLRSQVAHGRIAAIHCEEALALPGVVAVLTAADLMSPIPVIPVRSNLASVLPFRQPVMAEAVVRHVGEPIALVVAEGAEIAEDALQLIEVDIEHAPAVIGPVNSRKGNVLLFESAQSNCAASFRIAKGDAEAAFREEDYTRRECFSTGRQAALPMETRGVLANWDDAKQRLTVWGAAKIPFATRRALAAMLQLSEDAVDAIECDVGGGFGVRGDFYPEDFLIAFAARRLGRPVKWVEDRREHLLSTNHARGVSCDIEIACRRDGTILAMRGMVDVDVGAYVRPSITNTIRNAGLFLSGPYRIPHIEITAQGLLTNTTPCGVFRGPGRFESSFFCERMLDLAADDLGLDRVEMRRRNLIRCDEMPYPLAVCEPEDGVAAAVCDSGDYEEALDQCLREFDWERKRLLDGCLIDGRYHGIGVACFIEGGAAGPRENARIVALADGSVEVRVGSSAIGQGLETVLSQVAADALGLDMSRIRLLHGSTTLLDEGFGSFASRATVMGGNAIVNAASHFLQVFRQAAAEALGCPLDDLSVVDGVATLNDGRSVAIGQLAGQGLQADGTFSNSRNTYAYGAAAAHVAVDPRTGHVALLDYLVVDDVGRAINPLTLHGQVLGAIVQGLGGVFTEEIIYDADGQMLVASLADYLPPLATDFPCIRAVTTERHPSPTNPLGAKGAGEGGIIAPGGAVANAIASALRSLGIQPKALPLSPQRIWELLNPPADVRMP